MSELVFLDEARRELDEVVAWYAERAPIAATAFVETVEAALARLREVPRAAPPWPGRAKVRVRQLGRFPFLVLYSLLEDESIIVVAIAHQRRRPGYWLRRVP